MTEEQGNEYKFGQELDRKIWITKGARFNAHHRLMCKHSWSNAAIGFLSAYVIAFTLLQYFPAISLTTKQIDIISFSAIALSLFILVTSLLEASKSYQMKAMEFHNCGRELSSLYDKLRQILCNPDSVNLKKLTEISSDYAVILNKCQENHDVVDYDDFRIQHRHEFKLGVLAGVWFSLMSWVKSYLFYLLLIIVPPIVISMLLMAF